MNNFVSNMLKFKYVLIFVIVSILSAVLYCRWSASDSITANAQMVYWYGTYLFNRHCKVINGKAGWLFYIPSFKDELLPWPGDNIKKITAFNNELKNAGIKLMIVPVPDKEEIYSEYCFLFPPKRLPNQRKPFFMRLLDNQINAIDLADIFRNAKDSVQVYLKMDTHWNENGCDIAARKISDEIRRMYAPVQKEEYYLNDTLFQNIGDIESLRNGLRIESCLWKKVAVKESTAVEDFHDDRNADIMIFGDSFTKLNASFGGNIGARIAYYVGTPTFTFASLLAGENGIRHLKEILQRGKLHPKIIVWIFSSRSLAGHLD
jgi:hypothetical protein